MNLPVNRITLLKSVSQKPASLDSPLGEEENSTLGEIVPDEKATSPLKIYSPKA